MSVSLLGSTQFFANAPSFFPIYGAASLEEGTTETIAEGRELRSLLNGFGIKRKEAAKALGITRGELLCWSWGIHKPPPQILTVLQMAQNRREFLVSLGQLQGWYWDRFKKNHPFWREALEVRTAMRDWNLSIENICDATGLSAEDFGFILCGSVDPGKKWQEELRSLRDLKHSKPYWREAEQLRAAMEKWGISVQDITAATGMSHGHILCCKNGIRNPFPIFLAFQNAESRGSILEKLSNMVQEKRRRHLFRLERLANAAREREERHHSVLSFPFYFNNPHNRMVREIRLRLGITKKEMALALRVSLCTIYNWEKGLQSVSPPAWRRIEMAAGMETFVALQDAMREWNPEPLNVPTPNRPLTDQEQSFVQELFAKNELRIRHIAHGVVSRYKIPDVGEMLDVVMEAVIRVVLSGRIGRYVDPVTGQLRYYFIRLVLKKYFSEQSLLARGLKKQMQTFLNRMGEIEKKWQALHGRMITPEEFSQKFRITVAHAERLLEEYHLLSQVRPVSYDALRLPLASE